MATAKAMVPNIQAVVAEGALPAAKESITIRSLEMSDALWKIDSEQVVSKMAQALLTRVQSHANGAVMPMSTIIDVMGEVNRATPNVYGQMYDEDYETWFSQLRSYLGDKRSGLERVISVIENR